MEMKHQVMSQEMFARTKLNCKHDVALFFRHGHFLRQVQMPFFTEAVEKRTLITMIRN